MRKLFVSALVVGALAAGASARPPVDLALWTFEVSVPTTAGPITAEAGVNAATSFGFGNHAGATTYSNPVGNGSLESYSSTNWQVGDSYEFRTSSAGYGSLTVTWDQVSSGTGPRDFDLEVSIDSGATYSSIFSYIVLANAAPNPVWSSGGSRNPLYTYTAALPVSADDLADLRIRFTQTSTVSASGGTVGSGGTDRVDNVQISGELIPTPGALALLGLAGLAGARRRRA